MEVLPDAGHAQRPSGRVDLGQGDQQPDPVRPRPEGPRPDPRGRGHGTRLPAGRREGARRARGGPPAALRRRPGHPEGRRHGHRHQIGPDEAPLTKAMEAGSVSHTPSLSLNNDNAMSPRGGFWMMIGCGYCVKTIRRGRYLYFWHYEYRVGGRRQIEEYIGDRKSTRLNSSHTVISYAVFCLKKKKNVLYKCRLVSVD